MIEWIVGLLAAKWVYDKEEKKSQVDEANIDHDGLIPKGRLLNGYGYTRDNEDLRDLV